MKTIFKTLLALSAAVMLILLTAAFGCTGAEDGQSSSIAPTETAAEKRPKSLF